jgi:hypothetical protein
MCCHTVHGILEALESLSLCANVNPCTQTIFEVEYFLHSKVDASSRRYCGIKYVILFTILVVNRYVRPHGKGQSLPLRLRLRLRLRLPSPSMQYTPGRDR